MFHQLHLKYENFIIIKLFHSNNFMFISREHLQITEANEKNSNKLNTQLIEKKNIIDFDNKIYNNNMKLFHKLYKNNTDLHLPLI